MMNNKLIRLFLTIIGAAMFLVFMWYRFIRERLPKDIPFNLTEYGCIILIYISCIYLLVVITLIIKYNANNDLLSRIIDYIYKPLKVLDETFKTHPTINYYQKKSIGFLVSIIKEKHYTSIYYFFNIFPRFILITVFSLEALWLHHIQYLYKVILIGILIFLYKYYIYSLKYAKEQYILELESMVSQIQTDYVKYELSEEEKHDGYVLSFSFVSVQKFIEVQTDSIFYDNHKYSCNPLPYKNYILKFPDKTPACDVQKEPLRLLDIVVTIAVHLEEFDLLHNFNRRIKHLKIFIFTTYFICWSYILIVSLPTLPLNAFDWLWIIQDTIEPFSLTSIVENDTK